MGKKYKNPPVLEAICEFHFPKETSWDLTVPGVLYEKISRDFPHKEQRIIQEMNIAHDLKDVTRKKADRMLFFSDDRKTLIQLGNRLLSIHCLKPYEGWERFQPSIEKALKSLNEIIEITRYQKVALHYVNRVDLRAESTEVEDYFQFGINLGEAITQPMMDFYAGCSVAFEDRRDICRIQLTTTTPETMEDMSFILDINYFMARPEHLSNEETFGWIHRAHGNIESVFEGCITDRLRALFGEVN